MKFPSLGSRGQRWDSKLGKLMENAGVNYD